ncbi:MAG: tetratricopeptide repeat protein [Marinoscillum sp.]
MSFSQGYIFTIAGPLTSFLVSTACLYILIFSESHGALKLVSIFLFFSSIIDFFQNISPNKNPIMLHDGTLTYNDGQSLRLLREYRHVYKEITLLSQYYTNNEIEKGILFFEQVYSIQPDPNILRLGIALNMKGEHYKTAITLFDGFAGKCELSAEDYCNYALAYSFSGDHQIALDLYEESLKMNPEAFFSLNNRGYTLNILNRYEDAIADFDKAIELNPNFAYAYNNRGLSKIKLGKIKAGLNDIEKSMNIDDKNSYAYKNLGIYHKDKREYGEAMGFFLQAQNLDPKTDGLNELIRETERELKDSQQKHHHP